MRKYRRMISFFSGSRLGKKTASFALSYALARTGKGQVV